MALYRLSGYPVPNSYSPRSVFEIHGTRDGIVPYNNDHRKPHGAVQNIKEWGTLNQCSNLEVTQHTPSGGTMHRWTGCMNGATVQLLTLPGVNHYPYESKGRVSQPECVHKRFHGT